MKNKKRKIIKSRGNTYYLSGLGIPKGCEYCLNGEKTVFFLNGFCQKPTHCYWYCPISQERREKPFTFANETEIHSKKELLHEINIMDAKGMSITGGEPLLPANLEKSIEYISYMKEQKGSTFHIHLYTNGLNFNETIATRLSKAGLDEIRFHPPQDKWTNIKFALNKGMDVGAEIPVIPENKYFKIVKNFISFLEDIGADFINLNEFEYCFPNSQELRERGFQLEKDSIASVEDSRTYAFQLLNDLSSQVSIKMHFCTIASKDHWQLKKRYQRRAKGVKQPHEIITDEGLLMYAQFENLKKEGIKKVNLFLLNTLHIPQNKLKYEKETVLFPLQHTKNNQLVQFVENHGYKCYILETLPFEIKKSEFITEKTPLKVYLEEIGWLNGKYKSG